MQTLLNILLVLFVFAIIGIVFAVVTGKIAGGMDDPATSIPVRELPDGAVTAQDVAGLTFVPAFRGYRMSQVDAAMTRLQEEIARRDEELALLRPAEAEPVVEADAVAEPEPAPVVEAEPVAEVEPAAEPEPVVEAEPVAEVEPAAEPEPVVEADAVAEPEPVAEAETPDVPVADADADADADAEQPTGPRPGVSTGA